MKYIRTYIDIYTHIYTGVPGPTGESGEDGKRGAPGLRGVNGTQVRVFVYVMFCCDVRNISVLYA
jgi:hypothetical protein